MRAAGPADRGLLERVLLEALNWDGPRFTLEQARAMGSAWHYLDGWQRPDDVGVVVEVDAAPAGAAWARRFDASDPGYGFVDEHTPELTMGVLPEFRGRGLGAVLLDALLERVDDLSLSVEDGNDRARSLYESRGFRVVGRSGDSDTMLRRVRGERGS